METGMTYLYNIMLAEKEELVVSGRINLTVFILNGLEVIELDPA